MITGWTLNRSTDGEMRTREARTQQIEKDSVSGARFSSRLCSWGEPAGGHVSHHPMDGLALARGRDIPTVAAVHRTQALP